mmetsp:Transcript_77857/g.225934  ORF Transcript_77857/g.225934 Transcript_77857/m.225934 type:complete len:300 (-) Transcript_77857:550-1449(-)
MGATPKMRPFSHSTVNCNRWLDTCAAEMRASSVSPPAASATSTCCKHLVTSCPDAAISASASHAVRTEYASPMRAVSTSSSAPTATSAAGSSRFRTSSLALQPTTKAPAYPSAAVASYTTSSRFENRRIACTTASMIAGASSGEAPSDCPKEMLPRDFSAATTAPGVLKQPLRMGSTRARAPFICCTAHTAQLSTRSLASCSCKARPSTAMARSVWTSAKELPLLKLDKSLHPKSWMRPCSAFSSITCNAQGQPPSSAKAVRAFGHSIIRSETSSKPVASNRVSSRWAPAELSSTGRTV